MQRIHIESFGPIRNVELDLRDFMLFIGPQATGKSTVSKAIFFFKSLKDDFVRYILDNLETGTYEKALSNLNKRIKNKFLDLWGSSYHMQGICLEYDYGNGNSLTIGLSSGSRYIDVNWNRRFMTGFNRIIWDARRYAPVVAKKDPRFLSFSEILSQESDKRSFLNKVEAQISDLFNDKHDMMFIPAGRSLLATLADQLQNVETIKLDHTMRAFMQRISNSKALFSASLDQMVMDRKKLSQDRVDVASLSLAQEIIQNALKASYRADVDGEKLYYEKNHYTKLNFASSGQQEAIWILLMVFLIILENRSVFLVVEEPEAHLFPETQQDLMGLLALLSNLSENQILVTTHSPYVLSSVNNLLYAAHVGGTKPREAGRVVDSRLWLARERVVARFIEGGHARDIMDQETGLIETHAIDSASASINATFDKLVELDEC